MAPARPAVPLALVTGAASPNGIGAACARALADAGCDVAVIDRHPSTELRDAVRAAGRRCAVRVADLADPAALEAAVDGLRAELGDPSILVNNAADLTQGGLADTDPVTLARVLAVNVGAPVALCRRLVPAMARRGWGRIVNVTSDTLDRPPGPGLLAYITSKGALVGLTRALAAELGGDGITVNAIAPGLTDTGAAASGQSAELFDAVRRAQAVPRTLVPGDYAGLLRFLISAEAAIITGQTIRADAGLVFA